MSNTYDVLQDAQSHLTTFRPVPTTRDAIAAIMATEGNMELAAERLFGADEDHKNKERLATILMEDASAQGDLQRVLRTLSMLQAYSTFRTVSVVVEGTLDRMDANARGRFYTHLIQSLALLTDPHESTINAHSTSLNLSMSEAVMKSLPPEIQQALKVLQEPAPSGPEGPISVHTGISEPPNAAVGE